MSPAIRSPFRFVPHLEALEDRLVPAGVLTTKFSLGVLTITGENSVVPGANNQNFALLGASVGHVSISVQDGETIVGKNSFSTVKKVVLKLNDGDDTVTIVDLRLNKSGNSVDYQGGAGANSLFFDGTKIDIATFKASSGTAATAATDTFTVAPSDPTRMHFVNFTINAPHAACNLLLGGMGVDKTTKIVTSTTKDDLVEMDDNDFNTFTLTSGGGDDTVIMGHLDQDDDEHLVFKGNCTINLGDGNDSLTAGVSVHDPAGGDDLKKDLTKWLRRVVLEGGDGDDTLDVFHPRSTEFALDYNAIFNNWENIIYAP